MVMGQSRLRGSLTSPGSKGEVVVYLLESVGKELPAFRRFEVRVVGRPGGRGGLYGQQGGAARGGGGKVGDE